MDFPLFQILSFPDELEKSLNPQSQKYVRDTKAMVSTAVDVKELPDAYIFVADMPGLKSADMKVQLENDNVLVIGGTRKREEPDPKVKYIRMERNSGSFMRKFTLPQNSNLDKIAASCVDGILTVTVPKIPPPEPAKPRTIEVTMGNQ
uniref:Small heat-shock protein n=1 Tax=Funaria hygrometrica TaxID=29583 RepID=Q8L5F1_FUNHY|nr:small heat-shock protein [Funaria hygrometrica]